MGRGREGGRSGDGGVVSGGGVVNDNNNTFYLNAPCRYSRTVQNRNSKKNGGMMEE